jgi:hypothetical protein
MKKMQEKSKIYNIQGKASTPLKPSYMYGKHQFPPANQQIEKNQGVW